MTKVCVCYDNEVLKKKIFLKPCLNMLGCVKFNNYNILKEVAFEIQLVQYKVLLLLIGMTM